METETIALGLAAVGPMVMLGLLIWKQAGWQAESKVDRRTIFKVLERHEDGIEDNRKEILQLNRHKGD